MGENFYSTKPGQETSSLESHLAKLSQDISRLTTVDPAVATAEQFVNSLSLLDIHSDEERLHAVNNTSLPDILNQLLHYATSVLTLADPTLRLSHLVLATRCCAIIAELAKIDDARETLSQNPDIIPVIIQVQSIANRGLLIGKQVTTEEDECIVQTCRAIANLCYDNDNGREACLENDAVDSLLVCLRSATPRTLVIVCGTLLNISMDSEPTQSAIISKGGMVQLLGLVKYAADAAGRRMYPEVGAAALRCLSNLVEITEGQIALSNAVPATPFSPAGSGLSMLLHLLKHHHATILDPDLDDSEYDEVLSIIDLIVGVLESCSESNTIQRELVASDLLDFILDFVDRRPALKFLHRHKHAAVADDDEESQSGEHADYNSIRKTVSKIVTLVTMNDTNMFELTRKPAALNRFKTWLKYGFSMHQQSPIEEDEIRMNGALSIGNLARSDDTCVELVQNFQVAESLMELLDKEMKSFKRVTTPEERKGMTKVIHAVIGAFKNLSLAVGNRETLGKLGLIDIVSRLLETDVSKHVHYGCAVVLKNLSALGNLKNAFRIIVGQEPPEDQAAIAGMTLDPQSVFSNDRLPYATLVKVLSRATGDNDTGLRSEGNRVFVNLVKTCYQGGARNLINIMLSTPSELNFNPLFPLVTLITGKVLRNKLNEFTPLSHQDPLNQSYGESPHVHFETVPAEGQVFPVLQNEAIVASILLISVFPNLAHEFAAFNTILTLPLLRIISHGFGAFDDGGSGMGMAKSNSMGEDLRMSRSLSFGGDNASKDLRSKEYTEEMKCNAILLVTSMCKSSKYRSSIQSQYGQVIEMLSSDNILTDEVLLSPETPLSPSTPMPVTTSRAVPEPSLVPKRTLKDALIDLRNAVMKN